ncbi:hypothetical protein WICPIJ_005872 [Wickerhamomyces pijperi]|uniref:Inhibitor I9 domain-containing protein n=1 Tax=Wickerhamomyces pijperi TaxID=599730 RepID=A0A9P8Q4V6_WICPI|nr:hypothetical protein WICPIJ_005872 [Wickerhamomyces pijperi]
MKETNWIKIYKTAILTKYYRYIQLARSKVLELGGSINHEYSTVLTGFSFTLPSVETSANSINQLEKIMDPKFPFFIEPDSEVHIN